ncbi:MAG: glycosyltransferase family 1 protein, partial [candidate division Zixibacteria bacterium]|nr:glycosyltransferase family 1 protein [candidate division Zixibacteria bacterium]
SIPELVEDGVNGVLVPPADPVALAGAIERLLDSPFLRKQYGRAGFNFVTERRHFYSWEAVGERVIQALRALLEDRSL